MNPVLATAAFDALGLDVNPAAENASRELVQLGSCGPDQLLVGGIKGEILGRDLQWEFHGFL
jgi:hypothetical protein